MPDGAEREAAGVKVRIDAESLAPVGTRYGLSLEVDRPLLEVVFPVLDLPPGGDLVLPFQGGARLEDAGQAIRDAGGSWSLAYPGPLTMQFWQYGDTYVATDDRSGLFKRWDFRVLPDGRLEAALTQPTAPECRFESPYGTVVRPGFSDWFSAATHYRAWAVQQPWCARGRLEDRGRRGDLPLWLLDTDLWMWNRGTARGILRNAKALKETTGSHVSVLWYWWHRAAYDDEFPDYLPPREGWEIFDKTVSGLHARGLALSVYVNGRLSGLRSEAFTRSDLGARAAKPLHGDYVTEVYNRFTQAPMAVM